jgi:hypothetical protein
MWFNAERYHNTHSTQYRCTHYTLLSTAWCLQSVCSTVTPWCVILFSTNSSPVVHPPVHFPPEPLQSRHPPPPEGLSPEMRTVVLLKQTDVSEMRITSIIRAMEVVRISETSVCLYFETKQRYIPEGCHIHNPVTEICAIKANSRAINL